jgi:pimeloyl-ACP methyl ester carboxylesterase
MIPSLIPALLFIASNAIYWYLAIGTGLLSTKYFLQLALLGLCTASGIWLFAVLIEGRSSILYALILAFVALLTLLTLSLFFIKLFIRPGDRLRSLHSYSRSFARFDHPIHRFRLTTEDGVSIQAIQVLSDAPSKTAVIVCHGAGRSKDIHANVITCELLAEKYNVFTFDWRGHQESGGYWTGDGINKYDLKAVIEHVKGQGYEKIGVVAWSFGAWTAIIEGAEFKNFDALVAAAPPPTILREAAMAKQLFDVGLKWWAWPIRIALKALRNFRTRQYDFDLSLETVIGDLAPIPLLLVCNDFDTAIGVGRDAFQRLFDKAGHPKEFHVLKGEGHIYDWPNTFHHLNLVLNWLERTL